MQKSKESGDATSKNQYFSLKRLGVHVEYINGDHSSAGSLEPTSSSRTRDSVPNGQFKVASRLNQLTETMVVLLLDAVSVWHVDMVISMSSWRKSDKSLTSGVTSKKFQKCRGGQHGRDERT